MTSYYMSIDKMLQEELSKIDNEVERVVQIVRLDAQIVSDLWSKIAETIGEIEFPDRDTKSIADFDLILRTKVAQLVITEGNQIAKNMLKEFDNILRNIWIDALTYALTIDYILDNAQADNEVEDAQVTLKKNWLLTNNHIVTWQLMHELGFFQLANHLSEIALSESITTVTNAKGEFLDKTEVILTEFHSMHNLKEKYGYKEK